MSRELILENADEIFRKKVQAEWDKHRKDRNLTGKSATPPGAWFDKEDGFWWPESLGAACSIFADSGHEIFGKMLGEINYARLKSLFPEDDPMQHHLAERDRDWVKKVFDVACKRYFN
jgi:hypothetical protein